jgi:hypothetical protein
LRDAATDVRCLHRASSGWLKKFLPVLPADHPKQTPFFCIFYLLGDWREKAAYRTGAGHEKKEADEFLSRPGSTHTMTAKPPFSDAGLDVLADDTNPMPFDGKRMIFGGFLPIVEK